MHNRCIGISSDQWRPLAGSSPEAVSKCDYSRNCVGSGYVSGIIPEHFNFPWWANISSHGDLHTDLAFAAHATDLLDVHDIHKEDSSEAFHESPPELCMIIQMEDGDTSGALKTLYSIQAYFVGLSGARVFISGRHSKALTSYALPRYIKEKGHDGVDIPVSYVSSAAPTSFDVIMETCSSSAYEFALSIKSGTVFYSTVHLLGIVHKMKRYGIKYGYRTGHLSPLAHRLSGTLEDHVQFMKDSAQRLHFPEKAPHASALSHVGRLNTVTHIPTIDLSFEIFMLERFSAYDIANLHEQGRASNLDESFVRFLAVELFLRDVEKIRLCEIGIYFKNHTAFQWECYKGIDVRISGCLALNSTSPASLNCLKAHEQLVVKGDHAVDLRLTSSINTALYGSRVEK